MTRQQNNSFSLGFYYGTVHTYPDTFENRDYFPLFFKKYAFTRSVIKSFSPVHTKTVNNRNTIAFLTERASCQKLMGDDIIVLENFRFRPSTRKRVASVFKDLHSLWRAFLKRCVFGDVFSGYVSTVGQTRRTKILRFQTKMDSCGREQSFFSKINPVGAFPCLPYAFPLLICISVIVFNKVFKTVPLFWFLIASNYQSRVLIDPCQVI